RGPHQHVLLAERDRHLEHRAREQRDEDLRDREAEMEGRLAEYLKCRDHGRQMEPRIAQLRQYHWIGRAANRERAHAGMVAGSRAVYYRARCGSSRLARPSITSSRRRRLRCPSSSPTATASSSQPPPWTARRQTRA